MRSRTLLLLTTFLAASHCAAFEYSGYHADLVKQLPQMEENARIQLHFSLLLEKFKAKDTSALSPELREARQRNLETLSQYRDQACFPQNEHVAWRQPVFIDKTGTHCAVGYLVMASGHAEAALAISRRENLAYLNDIQSPELAPWIAASGLSKEECAMIQPGYSWITCPEPMPTATAVPRPLTQSAEVYLYHCPSEPGLLRVRAFTVEAIKDGRLVLSFSDGRPDQSLAFTTTHTLSFFAPFNRDGSGRICVPALGLCSSDPSSDLIALGVSAVSPYPQASTWSASIPLRLLLDAAALSKINTIEPSSTFSLGYPDCVAPNPQNPIHTNFDLCANVSAPAQISRVRVVGKDAFGVELSAEAYFGLAEVDPVGAYLDGAKEAAKSKLGTMAMVSTHLIHLFSGDTSGFCPDYLQPPTPLPTATLTPRPSDCAPHIENVAVVPSPLRDLASARVAVQLSGCAEKFRCQVYSSGNRCVAMWEAPANGGEGWQSLALPGDLEVSNGVYYIKVEAVYRDKRAGRAGVFAVLR